MLAKVIRINDNGVYDNIGNKAKSLMELKKSGFNVPGGVVIPGAFFSEFIKENQIENQISRELYELNHENAAEISGKIIKLFETATMPATVINEIAIGIDSGKKYAVRSSALKEDLDNHSFAGQYSTFLNVRGLDGIRQAIINCYESMYSETALSYLIRHNIGMEELEMAVIVQEMVDADASGIAFTVNPITGADKEIVIEAGEGLGEDVVSGRVLPERYICNWYNDTYDEHDNRLLNNDILFEMMSVFLRIQTYFGYPCDIEFAVKDGVLYILQARPITKIMYSGIADQWTTANFKDGGVSATVCRHFMWSLYEYIWEISYRAYLNKALLMKKKHMKKLGDMFFGRPYWNLTKAKLAMAKVPGYVEKNFDSEIGVKIAYEGSGNTTKVNLISLSNIVRIFLINKKITANKLKNNKMIHKELLDIYEKWLTEKDVDLKLFDFEKLWQELIFTHYLRSESTYFSQIFTNTIGQAIYKESLKKFVSESDYLNLLPGLQDVSHLRPFNDLWRISRKIRDKKDAFDFWTTASTSKIKEVYDGKIEEHFMPEFSEHIEKFGYHSDKELDVAYLHYAEDPIPVILSLKEAILCNNENSPLAEQEKQGEAYKKELDKLANTVKPLKYRSLVKQIEEMRKMLWWREEFKDISTRFYYLIRLYTMKLARYYTDEKIIETLDDIWFLKIEDIRSFMRKEISTLELRKIIEKNKTYYRSFRNFSGENEIGNAFDQKATVSVKEELKGIGCNNGIVTGVARVVGDFSEMDKIKPGDILVTKFTDTGWTSKFAVLKGIVTECGGTLCHLAIVSREYGIPCIVGATNVTKKIKDGSIIKIDGTTGAIEMMEDN